MDSPVNLYEYLCVRESTPTKNFLEVLDDISEHVLFQTMDQIIEQTYPDCKEYDVSDEDEDLPPPKKFRSEEDKSSEPSQDNLKKIVKKMYGLKEVITPCTKPEDVSIHKKIESIFSQMKQTVKHP